MSRRRSRLGDLAGAPPARLRVLNERTPLRIKLVAALLLLVAIALLVSGLVATKTLRGYLVDRVDSQLGSAVPGLVEHGSVEHGPGQGSGPDGRALPSSFVVELTNAHGTVVFGPTSNLLNAKEPLPRLPHPVVDDAAGDRTTRSFTVAAVRGHDQWRVIMVPVQLRSGGAGTLLVAQNLADVQDTVSRLGSLLLIIGVVAVVVLGGVAYVVVRASLRPLREVEDTAAAIAAGDLSQRVRPGGPRTEVGHLSHSFNDMLTRVESAFAVQAASEAAARRSEERMRRFVADASHELRTPLTSIRGFAELYRQGAAGEPADVKRLMRRIEDQGARMGLLVDDLLLLARLDQQRPLEQAPVDVLELTTDAVHEARALASDREVTMAIVELPEPPVVLGDEARLRQVLSNLVSNAFQHSPTGTSVEVRLLTTRGQNGGTVVVEVADQGPGMSAEEAARVFERFYRADASRNRDEGGTGLGLAIVSALVAGHGGTVCVDTAPGAGATFRVVLPLADGSSAPRD